MFAQTSLSIGVHVTAQGQQFWYKYSNYITEHVELTVLVCAAQSCQLASLPWVFVFSWAPSDEPLLWSLSLLGEEFTVEELKLRYFFAAGDVRPLSFPDKERFNWACWLMLRSPGDLKRSRLTWERMEACLLSVAFGECAEFVWFFSWLKATDSWVSSCLIFSLCFFFWASNDDICQREEEGWVHQIWKNGNRLNVFLC